MKPSFYNYYIPYNSGMVFMNGITESSFWVPESRADTYRTIIEDPDSYYAQFETFIPNQEQCQDGCSVIETWGFLNPVFNWLVAP